MGVQLNIKDEATVRLSRELADSGGRSVTETIREALIREREARAMERDHVLRRVKEISAEFRAHLPREWRGKTSKEIMDEIYDDDGLPI